MADTRLGNLDDVSPGGIALLVDAAGTIAAVRGQAANLIDGAEAELVGKNLFREVAPATNVPAFAGRFADGIRSGHGGDEFTFMLGRETGAVRLGVHIRPAARAALFEIVLEPLHLFETSRQREAQFAVDQRSRADVVDPSVCEREPIHIPGSIQPPAVLIGADPVGFGVDVASETVEDIFGLSAEALIGRPLSDILPASFLDEIRVALGDGAIGPAPIRFDLDLSVPARPFAVSVHVHDDRLLLEFEAAPTRPGDFGVPSYGAVRDGVRLLRREDSLDGLCQRAAWLIRRLTGYERVLIYRFDAEWNGEAIAESIVPDWAEPLLGLRFPASDIPRQARDLYRVSPARYVVDRDAAPVPLRQAPGDNSSVDLSRAIVRSLSPIHIEYQRNLGVNGSMSIAILVGGQLWGLVIGHHRRPHYVAPETRDAMAVLTDAVALGIQDLERERVRREQEETLAVQVRLLAQMAEADDAVEALAGDGTRLTDLFGATGAALVIGGHAVVLGRTPPLDEVAKLARALADGASGEAVATDHLASLHPAAETYAAEASGLLAAFIDQPRGDVAMWFRPELVTSVTWGGDPRKPVLADTRSAAILPRRSFERWVEERRGHSEPWSAWQAEVATALARAVVGMSLRVSRRVGELSTKQDELLDALAQKDALIADKDLLTREIDHRVKNSLQIVSAFLRMQARQMSDPDAQEAFRDSYGRVMSIARVHDSLYQSSDVTEVDLGHTIEALCRDLAGVSGESRELELSAESGLMVPYRKAVALCLIATELVTNAWKYAYPGQLSGLVEVVVKRDGSDLKLRVCDQGNGLPPDWDASANRGLGMKLVEAMMAQIDARLEVETARGACFTVVC